MTTIPISRAKLTMARIVAALSGSVVERLMKDWATFKMIDPIGPDVIERGIFAAEIVDRDLYAELAQLRENRVLRPGELGQGCLGDVKFEIRGRKAPLGERLGDVAHQLLPTLELK